VCCLYCCSTYDAAGLIHADRHDDWQIIWTRLRIVHIIVDFVSPFYSGVQLCSMLASFWFLVYINVPLNSIEQRGILILFADDTSILIIRPNDIQFPDDLNIVFGQWNKWFKANLLSLNFDKTFPLNVLIKVHIHLTYRLRMTVNKFLQLLKQNFLGYLLQVLFRVKHTLNILSLNDIVLP
jgi:hypothetical protein